MLSLNLLGRKGVEEYCRYVEEWCGDDVKTSLSLEKDNMYSFLEVTDADRFILLRFNGDFAGFHEEMDLLKPLGKVCKMIMAIQGNSYMVLEDVFKIRSEVSDYFGCGPDDYLMGYADVLGSDDFEVQILVKTYSGVDLSDDAVFSSLWQRVLKDAQLDSDMSFYSAVKDLVPVGITNNVITLRIPDMTRVRFIMSVKSEKLEYLIREYTCNNYILKII